MIYDYRDQVKAILQTVNGDDQASLLTGAVAIKSVCETALATMQQVPEPKDNSRAEAEPLEVAEDDKPVEFEGFPQMIASVNKVKRRLKQVTLEPHYQNDQQFLRDVYRKTGQPAYKHLSLALGLGSATLANFFKRPNPKLQDDTIVKIANVLGITADDLTKRLRRNKSLKSIVLKNSYKTYSELFNDILAKSGYTQRDLALEMDIAENTVNTIVNGVNQLSRTKTRVQIANALGLTAYEFDLLVNEGSKPKLKPKPKETPEPSFALTSHTSNFELIDRFLDEPLEDDEYMVRRDNQLARLIDQSGRELLALSWGMVRKYNLETGDIVTAKLTELKPKVLRVIHRHLGLDNFKLLRSCPVEKGINQNEWDIAGGLYHGECTSLGAVNPSMDQYIVPRELVTKLGIKSESKADLIWQVQEPNNVSIAAVHE